MIEKIRSSIHIIHMEDALRKTVASRADAYDGPISSETGKQLWAIQSWYAEMENEKFCEVILAAHDSECVLAA
jgi:hypothetical protein